MTSEGSICISWSMLPLCYETLAEAIHTTIQPEFRVPTELFILYACDLSKKIYSLLFFSAWPFDQKLGSSLIYFFFFSQPSDQNIWSSFIYTFFWAQPFNKNIWPFSIYCFFCPWPFSQKLRSTLIYFFICTRPFNQKLGSLLIYWFYIYTTIQPKLRVLINLLLLFVRGDDDCLGGYHPTPLYCPLYWCIFS